MVKRSVFTNITPLPSNISRETALDFIHDHAGMIELNPLVIRHSFTQAHPNASPEEASSCTWYEITDNIAFLPGGIGKSEVKYKGGFYDRPNGLQTHVWAPAGVDIRAHWRICGSLPGEKREVPELGLDTPKEGLYLREDVDLRCSLMLSGFVKRNLKKSHAMLVDTLVKKAQLAENNKSVGSMPLRSGVTNGSQNDGSMSQASAVTAREVQPCGCTGSAHETDCPLYSSTRSGSNTLPGLDPTNEPRAVPRPVIVNPGSNDYSPVSKHPCYCNGVHIASCQLYPGLVQRSDQRNSVHGSNLTPPGDDWNDSSVRPQALRPRSMQSGAAMELDGFPVASGRPNAVELE